MPLKCVFLWKVGWNERPSGFVMPPLGVYSNTVISENLKMGEKRSIYGHILNSELEVLHLVTVN